MNIPEWVYKDTRPESDEAYFENMTRCIFQAGLNWQIISNKWPDFRRVFKNFDFRKVAVFGVEDVNILLEDPKIIRNRRKILATINNAGEFERIAEKEGSFQRWLDGFDKSNNYDVVVKRLKSHFKHVGPSTAHIFLWSVGEDIKYDPAVHPRKPKKVV
jgi:DNA-3-methyladenine glycosylase I